MTDPILSADYVRIEIHAGGKARIIEFEPDRGWKVEAKLTMPDRPSYEVNIWPKVRDLPVIHDVAVNLAVSGPTAVWTLKDSER